MSSWHDSKTGTIIDSKTGTIIDSPQCHLRDVHHFPIGLFLENLVECVSSSQHELAALAALGLPLLDTTGAARRVLFASVGSVLRVYWVAAV